jgi:ribosomal protein S27AE
MTTASPAPKHREAYPKFDVVQSQAAWFRWSDACACVFELNDNRVGDLIVTDSAESFVEIAYSIAGDHIGREEGQCTFDLRSAGNAVYDARLSLVCPRCSAAKSCLYFKGRWACARCHRLMYRSQLVPKSALLRERYNLLGRDVREGRPKGMHNRTYQRLLDEHAKMGKLLGRSRTYLSPEQRLQVHSVWRPVREVHYLWVNGYVIENGSICRREISS